MRRGKSTPPPASSRWILHRILPFDGVLDHARRLVAIGIGIGIDPSWVDEQDMPAIHIAGWEGQADVVEWLLDFGPDLARKNMYGGDLMGTVVHSASSAPTAGDATTCAVRRLVLDAGSMLQRANLERRARSHSPSSSRIGPR